MLADKLRAATAGVGEIEFSFIGSANSGANTITLPASTAVGDVIVLADSALNVSGIPTEVLPSGFTKIVDLNNSNNRNIVVSWGIATSGGAGVLTGMNGSNDNDKVVMVFRPSSAIQSGIEISSLQSEITNSNPAPQVIPCSEEELPLVAIAVYRHGSSGFSIDFSPTEDFSESTNTLDMYVKIYNTDPTDITADLNDAGVSNVLVSFYFTA